MNQFKRDEKQNSNKLHLDKYYTSDETAQYCIDVTKTILGNQVTEIIEPSAGSGSSSKKLRKCIAYDIEPEDESIIKQDFLELNLEYKKGRLFIGNPPFGARNTLAVLFISIVLKWEIILHLFYPSANIIILNKCMNLI